MSEASRRDPRVAVHSPTLDPPEGKEWPGDAKLAGLLEELRPGEDAEPGSGLFRLDIREVALTYVGKPADHLVIESWHADRGWERRTH